jgi:wyosine [tRNA(Phe)-imidazoG37] synthetase (radical SAM superfamily)
MITFGPVPSRRLGYSLGVNHIPPKHCTYSCVYCQVGRTTYLQVTRREFFPVQEILDEVSQSIKRAEDSQRKIDFITLVPDGEPTLDIHLGELIGELKQFKTPIAVITNASLIDRQDVQQELMQADWVSLKVDSVNEETWRKINRPHGSLQLSNILTGIMGFKQIFKGELVTETLLVSGINDQEKEISDLLNFLLELQPFKSYLSIPTRPPAESWVKPPDAETLQRILHQVEQKVTFIDLLFEAEEDDFSSTGDLLEDILSTTAVHPIRESALKRMVERANADWNRVESFVQTGKLTRISYRGVYFYLPGARRR